MDPKNALNRILRKLELIDLRLARIENELCLSALPPVMTPAQVVAEAARLKAEAEAETMERQRITFDATDGAKSPVVLQGIRDVEFSIDPLHGSREDDRESEDESESKSDSDPVNVPAPAPDAGATKGTSGPDSSSSVAESPARNPTKKTGKHG